MPKLTLKFDGRVLKEYAVDGSVTIGRLPDNSVVIDNPAVSGHHARIFRDGDRVILEDLHSTNGTFVNAQLVTRHPLRAGDVLLIGKHKLVYEHEAGAPLPAAEPAISGLGDTMYLDTKQHRALMASLQNVKPEEIPAAVSRPAAKAAVPVPDAFLRVVSGASDHSEYDLNAHTSLIGKSNTALVRLKGWFKPDVAVAIARNGEGYVATALRGKTLINSRRVSGRHSLRDGDILSVSGLTLEFRAATNGNGDAVAARHDAGPEAAIRPMSSGERVATARALT